jgi:hypothetical protein
MNDLTPVPRSKQTPISIRSNEAAQLLSELTKDGRSQAEVIESGLRREKDAKPKLTREEFKARLDAIAERAKGYTGPSREEIEAEMYDEYGAPR